jgi:putative restriction endonuclease
MDRHLIAPTPAGVWKVSRVLIGHRSTGEAELVRLADHPVLPPTDDAYRPDPAAMQWRVERLIA